MSYDYDQTDGSALTGFIGWIAVLVIINVLSYAFDWPFWVY